LKQKLKQPVAYSYFFPSDYHTIIIINIRLASDYFKSLLSTAVYRKLIICVKYNPSEIHYKPLEWPQISATKGLPGTICINKETVYLRWCLFHSDGTQQYRNVQLLIWNQLPITKRINLVHIKSHFRMT